MEFEEEVQEVAPKMAAPAEKSYKLTEDNLSKMGSSASQKGLGGPRS